jgi:hypothetical protein
VFSRIFIREWDAQRDPAIQDFLMKIFSTAIGSPCCVGFPTLVAGPCRDLRCPRRIGQPTTGRLPPPCNRGQPHEMQTLGHVRESSRAHNQQIRARSVSAHITSLFFPVDRADEDAPLCSHARFRACCPGPLLAPCSASCSSLLMQQMQTLSDSFARRTWGSDSPLESVSLPSHPVAALSRAAGSPYSPHLSDFLAFFCRNLQLSSHTTLSYRR